MSDPEPIWVAGMPDELAAAIARLDITCRRAAITGWLNIGVEGRQRYADFVHSAGFEWTRRLRCRLAVRRLIKAADS
jgi:hypothetical protein